MVAAMARTAAGFCCQAVPSRVQARNSVTPASSEAASSSAHACTNSGESSGVTGPRSCRGFSFHSSRLFLAAKKAQKPHQLILLLRKVLRLAGGLPHRNKAGETFQEKDLASAALQPVSGRPLRSRLLGPVPAVAELRTSPNLVFDAFLWLSFGSYGSAPAQAPDPSVNSGALRSRDSSTALLRRLFPYEDSRHLALAGGDASVGPVEHCVPATKKQLGEKGSSWHGYAAPSPSTSRTKGQTP